MSTLLLERDAELELLEECLADAVAGAGSVVLVAGEAGTGKTNLVRAFRRRAASGRARVLVGACDDLLTPRTFGPLRDVARAGGVPGLAAALVAGDRDAVLVAARDALAAGPGATVLVVEDAHWADAATLDVVRFVGRRIADLPAVLVVTYREHEAGPGHPLRQVLGGLTGPSVRRLALHGLSRAAVARWAEGSGVAAGELYRLTEGNPFFVSEVLAQRPADGGRVAVPTTVVDAVLARIRGIAAETQEALHLVAVVPSQLELPLARALLGDLAVLAEAERLGVLEVRPDAVAFRHELARRAVEGALPVSERMRLNERVLTALLGRPEPDLARVVHHAVGAGDEAAVLAHAPAAARRAAQAGAQTEAAALYAQALAHAAGLPPADEAALREARAWTLYDSGDAGGAVAEAETAVRLREGAGRDVAGRVRLGLAVASLALWQWADLRPEAALASCRRAAPLLAGAGDRPERSVGQTYLGVVLVSLGREADALGLLEDALAVAARTGAPAPPLARIYLGRARLELGDPDGLAELERGLDAARAAGRHADVMIGYLTAVALLWRAGRYGELPALLDAGADYGRDRDFPTHDRGREAFRHRLAALRGDWDGAERGLRGILGDGREDGVLGRHALPTLALLAVRRGDDGAAAALDAARDNAERAGHLSARLDTAVAELEHAWLLGRGRPATVPDALLAAAAGPGRLRERAELLRGLRRLGEPVDPFDGCPEEFAAGLRGDWRAAAAAWRAIGAPYEEALELLDSGEVAPTTAALEAFDRLGARPAAALARRRLRELGVAAVPRGPQPATRGNPAGLTGRQLEILRLLAEGRTNSEIAARLVLSVRTVDHHVSAVLQKLGVGTRREAAAVAARLAGGGPA